MSYNVKNYTEQGGEKTVIGGTLEVLDGATITGVVGVTTAAKASAIGGIKAATKGAGDTVEVKIDTTSSKLFVPTYPVIPKATKVAEAVGDAPTKAEFKALITALVTAGLMAAE